MTDERDLEQPELRERAFFAALGVQEPEYRQMVNRAVDHALQAPRDPLAPPWTPWGARNIGGRARALVQHPKIPAIMYVGMSQGGVYRSDDHGDTWVPLGEAHHVMPVGALGLGPKDPNILYIGSGEPGVLHRISAGSVSSFETFAAGLGFFRYDAGAPVPRLVEEVRNQPSSGANPVLPAGAANGYARIVVDPNDSERCWIASNSGLWRRERGPMFIPEPLPVGGRVQDTQARFEPPLAAGTAYRRLRGGSGPPRAGPSNITSTGFDNLVTGSGFRGFLSVGDVIVTTGLPVNQARVVLEVVSDTQIQVGYRSAPVTDVELSTNWSPRSPNTYRILAAVGAQGIHRGVFTPADLGTSWEPRRLEGGLPLPFAASEGEDIDRIRVTASPSLPAHVYALYEKQSNRNILALFHSKDGGHSWTRHDLTVDLGGQAFVNLVCSVHPDNPALVIVGAVDMARSRDFGVTWEKILDSRRPYWADPAQHGDQHTALFDVSDPHRLWVSNDGGVSLSSDIVDSNPDSDRTWRKRSHGIVGAQFNDITVHPSYPFIIAGGLQDNGTYVGIGGETWLHRGDGDGGLVTFRPNDPRTFVYTVQYQGPGSMQVKLSQIVSGSVVIPVNPFQFVLRSQVNGDLGRPLDLFGSQFLRIDRNPAIVGAPGPFVGMVEGHPVGAPGAHHFLVGRQGAVFATATGINPFANGGIPTGPPAPANQQFTAGTMTSALAYDTSAPSGAVADWWVGTNAGQLFRRVHNTTPPAGTVTVVAGALRTVIGDAATNFPAVFQVGDSIILDPGGPNQQQEVISVVNPGSLTLRTALASPVTAPVAWQRQQWSNLAPSGLAGTDLISRVLVHPARNNYVVMATAGRTNDSDDGRVFLSIDRGFTWADVSGRGGPAVAGASPPTAVAAAPPAQSLPPGPITGLAFDPTVAPGSPQVLYAATLAGIYVIRNLPPATAAAMPAFNPYWFVFNNRQVAANRFDPVLSVATSFDRVRAGAMTGGSGQIRSDQRSALVTGTGTRFTTELQVGDLIRTRGRTREQERVVEQVIDDTHLLTSFRATSAAGFAPALPAGTAYSIQSAAGGASVNGVGTISSNGTAVTGSGTSFEDDVRVGDILHSRGLAGGDQARVVVAIQDDTHLTVAMQGRAADRFSPALPARTVYAKDLHGVLGSTSSVGTVACTGTSVNGTGTPFDTFFAVGDTIHVTPAGGGPTQSRKVAGVGSATRLTVSRAFAPNIGAGGRYAKSVSGAGTVACAGATVTGAGTNFIAFFQPGDTIQVTPSAGGASQARIVASVESNTSLTVADPFGPAIPANADYCRSGAGLGTIASSVQSNVVTGTNTAFTSFFRPGDVIRAAGQTRIVEAVESDTRLTAAADPPPEHPLVLVKDLAVATHPPAPGAAAGSEASVTRQRLLSACYGRGILNCDLTAQPAGVPAGGPRHRLYIRQYSVEDGLDYPRAAPALLNRAGSPAAGAYPMQGDPRVPATRANFGLDLAYDIRVDNEPFQFFEEVVDGVDFDEQLRTKPLVPGRTNFVYVQVHTRGWDTVRDARVHLYFAPAPAQNTDDFTPALGGVAYQRARGSGGAPANLAGTITSAGNLVTGAGGTTFQADFQPGDLIVAGGQTRLVSEVVSNTQLRTSAVPLPDLHADFWAHHLEDPLPAPAAAPAVPRAAWQRAAKAARLRPVGPNQPAVARFEWVPPASLGGQSVALLAVVTSAHDPLPANPPTELWRLTVHERRAACRIVPASAFVPDFYIRDGNEDDGRPGSVAYGGRSPDIMVQRAAVPEADRRNVFKDLTDPRTGQAVEHGQTEHVFVRVFNRLEVPAEVEVDVLWTRTNVPTAGSAPDAPFEQDKWRPIGGVSTVKLQVPARDWAVAQLQWNDVPDLSGEPPGLRAVALIALLASTTAGDARPVPGIIHDDPEAFWRFFMDQASANNAALRVVPVKV